MTDPRFSSGGLVVGRISQLVGASSEGFPSPIKLSPIILTPTDAEALLYELAKIAPEIIECLKGDQPQQMRRAHGDDLQRIFDLACKTIIRRKSAGVDFSHLDAGQPRTVLNDEKHDDERSEKATMTKV